MKKRIISILLIIVMLLTLIPVAMASPNPNNEQNDGYNGNSSESNSQDFVNPNANVTIDEEVASYIALFFINDMVGLKPSFAWTSETSISNIVTLVCLDNFPVAFSVELETNGLDTGYILISAFLDVPNIILGFADEALPLYHEFDDFDDDSTVIFTGPFSYFLDNEDGTFETLSGEEITEEEIGTDIFEEMRSCEYFEAIVDMLDSMESDNTLFDEVNGFDVTTDTSDPSELSARSPINTRPEGEISDPFALARNAFGGTWVNNSWINQYENFTRHLVGHNMTPRVAGEYNCVPTTLTNIVVMIDRRLGGTPNNNTIYGIARRTADNFGYNTERGMPLHHIAAYTQSVLRNFGYAATVTQQVPTVDRIRTQLRRGLPFPLVTLGHGHYRSHAVAAYAYTQLRRTSDNALLTFMKVSDGWVSSGRFVALITVNTTNTGAMFMWTSTNPAFRHWGP